MTDETRKIKFHLFDINPVNTEYDMPVGAQLLGLVPVGTDGLGNYAVRAIFIEEFQSDEDREMAEMRKELEAHWKAAERDGLSQQLDIVRNGGIEALVGGQPRQTADDDGFEMLDLNEESGEAELRKLDSTFGPNSVGEGGTAARRNAGRPQVPGPGEDLATAERDFVDSIDLRLDTDGDGDGDVDAVVEDGAVVEVAHDGDNDVQDGDKVVIADNDFEVRNGVEDGQAVENGQANADGTEQATDRTNRKNRK